MNSLPSDAATWLKEQDEHWQQMLVGLIPFMHMQRGSRSVGVGAVYVLETGEGWYKFGATVRSVTDRMKSVFAKPDELRVAIVCNEAFSLESFLQWTYKDYRERYDERFKLPVHYMDTVTRLANLPCYAPASFYYSVAEVDQVLKAHHRPQQDRHADAV